MRHLVHFMCALLCLALFRLALPCLARYVGQSFAYISIYIFLDFSRT